MNQFKILFIVACFAVPFTGLAQSDQNFKVKGSTDCNEISLYFPTMEEAEVIIHKAKFNIEQEMNTTRPSGYRKAHFRSCNMQDGFLMLQIDSSWTILREFPVEMWNEYVNSRDLEGYYQDNVKGKFPLVTDPI